MIGPLRNSPTTCGPSCPPKSWGCGPGSHRLHRIVVALPPSTPTTMTPDIRPGWRRTGRLLVVGCAGIYGYHRHTECRGPGHLDLQRGVDRLAASPQRRASTSNDSATTRRRAACSPPPPPGRKKTSTSPNTSAPTHPRQPASPTGMCSRDRRRLRDPWTGRRDPPQHHDSRCRRRIVRKVGHHLVRRE